MIKKTPIFLIISILIFSFSFLYSKTSSKNMKKEKTMRIQKKLFGKMPDGTKIYQFKLKNKNNLMVSIINYGGIINSIKIPDKNGKFDDIVLGFNCLKKYLAEHPYFGAIIGRYANRIADGEFTLNDKQYNLAKNNGNNHLHGGIKGFDKVVWDVEAIDEKNEWGVLLKYTSPDGEEGYPGKLETTVKYTLNDKNELKIEYTATTDKPTPVNLTNHSYFNLKCAGCGTILDHYLKINADKYTEVNDELIPTGEINKVQGTPLDFTSLHLIGKRIDKIKGGYDHNFILNKKNKQISLAAKVVEKETGRIMEVYTTQPGLQFYSGNFLDGSIRGKNRKVYKKHYGFCLETQHFPDSPNHPGFPSTILNPGEKYLHTTIYKFLTKK